MKIIKEISDYSRFFKKTKKEHKDIVFYAEHTGYYPYFEGMINEIVYKQHKTICYITSDSKDPILKNENPLIKVFYIKKKLANFFKSLDCRVFVMTLTDLNNYYLKKSSNIHYVYAFHSIVSTHMMYNFGAFDYYDSVLCVGPHHIKEIQLFEKQNNLTKKKLIEAGYFRLERIYKSYKNIKKQKIKNEKLTVLIAPSWGEENILESCGDELINLLLNNNYKVIVRPHPETIRRYPYLIQKLAYKFTLNDNFTLEKSIVTDDSILKSDVLICDCSGIALEYAFGTERPVIFLDVPLKIKNKKYKELNMVPIELSLRTKIGKLISIDKLNTLPEIINNLENFNRVFKSNIVEQRNKYIFNFENSSKISVDHILSLLT